MANTNISTNLAVPSTGSLAGIRRSDLHWFQGSLHSEGRILSHFYTQKTISTFNLPIAHKAALDCIICNLINTGSGNWMAFSRSDKYRRSAFNVSSIKLPRKVVDKLIEGGFVEQKLGISHPQSRVRTTIRGTSLLYSLLEQVGTIKQLKSLIVDTKAGHAFTATRKPFSISAVHPELDPLIQVVNKAALLHTWSASAPSYYLVRNLTANKKLTSSLLFTSATTEQSVNNCELQELNKLEMNIALLYKLENRPVPAGGLLHSEEHKMALHTLIQSKSIPEARKLYKKALRYTQPTDPSLDADSLFSLLLEQYKPITKYMGTKLSANTTLLDGEISLQTLVLASQQNIPVLNTRTSLFTPVQHMDKVQELYMDSLLKILSTSKTLVNTDPYMKHLTVGATK